MGAHLKSEKKATVGAKMKKALGGMAMKKINMMREGGASLKLKKVPSDAKGLSKLPTSVRNKMGFMEYGASMKKKMTMGGRI
jgi:hypothetical protein